LFSTPTLCPSSTTHPVGTWTIEWHRTNHSRPSHGDVKNSWVFTFSPPYVFKLQCLKRSKNFTLDDSEFQVANSRQFATSHMRTSDASRIETFSTLHLVHNNMQLKSSGTETGSRVSGTAPSLLSYGTAYTSLTPPTSQCREIHADIFPT
jgi:hypothetical protein